MYYTIYDGNKIIYDFLITKCKGESSLFSIDNNNILRSLCETISEEEWNNANVILSTDYNSLKFHCSWDWLIPVIQVIMEFDELFADQILIDKNIKQVWKTVVENITLNPEKYCPKREIGEEVMYNGIKLRVSESDGVLCCDGCYFDGKIDSETSLAECNSFKYYIGDCIEPKEIIFKEIKDE